MPKRIKHRRYTTLLPNIKLVARPARSGNPFKIDEKGLTRRSVPDEEHGATPTTLPVDFETILALSRTFAPGHVYVGLSRLRSPEGLILAEENFEAKVDPFVLEYYRDIREGHGR